MARTLPWATGSEPPPPKRVRTANPSSPRNGTPRRDGRESTVAQKSTSAKNPLVKRRATSRTPSTSPPPGPPDVEPMIEGYDNDDIWMMVEDEFQTLAQSFTAHLHHAEYKRLMKAARDAPVKELPDPASPMSKETKRKLQQAALGKRQQETLRQITSGGRLVDASDAEEEKVEDPWRGTALAGLMSLGSQQKTSLKGLEKMPSSTRAAQGFSKTEVIVRPQRNAVDELTKPPERRKDRVKSVNRISRDRTYSDDEDQDSASSGAHDTRDHPNLSPAASNGTASVQPVRPTTRDGSRPPSRTSYLLKRKKVNEESKEDRLAEVPMFLY